MMFAALALARLHQLLDFIGVFFEPFPVAGTVMTVFAMRRFFLRTSTTQSNVATATSTMAPITAKKSNQPDEGWLAADNALVFIKAVKFRKFPGRWQRVVRWSRRRRNSCSTAASGNAANGG